MDQTPIKRPFVAYLRLSKESISGGLGIDAQRHSIAEYVRSVSGMIMAEFLEIESGKRTDRPELLAAIAMCRRTKARLLIAKLDRLSRNASFLLALRDSGVDFVAADLPNADRLTVGIMALVAEFEREQIGRRTREALAQAKLRGVRLGSPDPRKGSAIAVQSRREKARRYAQRVMPVLEDIRSAGVSGHKSLAAALNARGIRTPTNREFSPQAVANFLWRFRSNE